MNRTTTSVNLKDAWNKTADTNMNKFTVRGGQRSYKSVETEYKYNLDCYSVLSSVFPIPSSGRVLCIIQSFLDSLHPTLVDHLGCYLSICPIRHPIWSSVSCGCQGSTVQGSSPHKYGQKSSCNAFNAIVVVFSQIFFLGFPYFLYVFRTCPCH